MGSSKSEVRSVGRKELVQLDDERKQTVRRKIEERDIEEALL